MGRVWEDVALDVEDGIEVYYLPKEGFKLTARSWQLCNPNLWRPGTTMYKVAMKNGPKANEILRVLNGGGSYINEHGMKFFRGPSGRIAEEAVSGPALEMQERLKQYGDTTEEIFGVSGNEWELIAMESMDEEEKADMVGEIFSMMSDKISDYMVAIKEAIDNITNYSPPVSVIVI